MMESTSVTQKNAASVPGTTGSLFKRRVLILGAGKLACDLYHALNFRPTRQYQVVGLLDKEHGHCAAGLNTPSVIGTYDRLFEMVERYQIQLIAVCLDDRRALLPVQALLDIKTMGLDVVDGHQLYEEATGRLSIDQLKPSALIFSTGFRRRTIAMVFKRVFDVLCATVSLIVLLPLFCLIGVLVKMDSPGPILYRQVRVGLMGQPYMIWKFRSMRNDAEKSGPRWAQPDDPRVSRIGWWLRKTRLDELPQLINVLKGEMSLVGPRPERPVFVQELRSQIPYYDIRHTVKPGITGWAQTKFRYGASAEDAHTKLQYDLYYVKNMTFALDVRILVETIRVVLLGEGAR